MLSYVAFYGFASIFSKLVIGTACFVYDLHAAPTGGCFWQFVREKKLTDIFYCLN